MKNLDQYLLPVALLFSVVFSSAALAAQEPIKAQKKELKKLQLSIQAEDLHQVWAGEARTVNGADNLEHLSSQSAFHGEDRVKTPSNGQLGRGRDDLPYGAGYEARQQGWGIQPDIVRGSGGGVGQGFGSANGGARGQGRGR